MLDVAVAPGYSGRFLLVVGLLVVLVGVVSVGGTMFFLGSQAQSEQPGEGVEPQGVQAQPVQEEREAAGDVAEVGAPQGDEELAEKKEGAPGGEAAVPEEGAPGGEVVVPEPEGVAVDDVVEVPEPTPTADDDSARGVDAAEPEDEEVKLGESGGSADDSRAEPPTDSQPRVPRHETPKCVETREAARTALGQRNWPETAKLAKQGSCWPANEQSARRLMLVNALLESGRFAECVKAGKKAKDSGTMKMVETCSKRMGN